MGRMGIKNITRGKVAKKKKIPKKFHLSHAHIQMARELGMNPKKFGSLLNHKQEPWKLLLPEFIEKCYKKRFDKNYPDKVIPIEEKINKKK